MDEFGDMVQIAPYMGDGKHAKRQSIVETYCAEDHNSCRGVNPLFFESTCATIRHMVHARVIKAGKLGWGSVYVRVACNCVVMKKRHY